MKLEVGESLIYSWLRHVKGCQVVQMNWKRSPVWTFHNEDKIEQLRHAFEEHYKEYSNFFGKKKKGQRHEQILKQAEVDVLGLSMSGGAVKYYAVDVAFHEGGLGYPDNVKKVTEKILRMAMCVYGYFNTTEGEIIFATPKVGLTDWKDLEPCESRISDLLKNNGLDFKIQIIANVTDRTKIINDRFQREILEPVQAVADKVKDMSELFLRSYKLLICK